ncbi:MAG: hydantoinase/oxoprolinase family protein [Ahrensia sp.]|nr:hydantoinase/oxoprolinase family protein [Ahrensia sp.]
MALLMGIDTGGTFTDAVIFDDQAQSADAVIAKAKALTTHHRLSTGIAEAVQAVLGQSKCAPSEIAMVSLSTTLATNALVEGQGERVALIAIGFEEQDMRRAGLESALGKDPLIVLPGGHTTHGNEARPLDLTALEQQLLCLADDVSGFAVAGYFAVRNPAHELAVARYVSRETSAPLTCSHELSHSLNGPRRALTTVLNARLVPMITRLIEATRTTLGTAGVEAPLMVVRGDGALIGADFAVKRPIETILSGPAASLVGAHHLTGVAKAVVNDVGGTTSDVAVLQDGQPKLDPDGAMVGGYRTMVRAVAMHTFGLGGDSQVALGGPALKPRIDLGPKRVVPIALLAHEHTKIVHAALDAQLKAPLTNRHDGTFAQRAVEKAPASLSVSQRRLFDRLTNRPIALNDLLKGHAEAAALAQLVARSLVRMSGLTPTDALHVLEATGRWDVDAARKACRLFGRRRDGAGSAFCDDPEALAALIVKRMRRRSAEVVLETAFASEGRETQLVGHPLVAQILDRREEHAQQGGLLTMSLKLDRPLIGLGASAHVWHPQAADLLTTTCVVPDHADVANAVGAVVGQISVAFSVTVSQPAEGRYSVTGLDQPFTEEAAALKAARSLAQARANEDALAAGAEDVRLQTDLRERRADIEGRSMLVEAVITATASGRPAIAH